MKKKHAPEQYAAKPKAPVVKPSAKPPAHPASGVAKQLVNWIGQGGVPPSVILLHGLHWARGLVNDGLPVDTHRPQLNMQGTDNRAISEVMDAMARPQADKTQVIAAWLQSVWVKKPPTLSRISPIKNVRKASAPPKKQVKPKRKSRP